MARGQDVLCVGDGALRYRDEIHAELRCEFAEQFLSHPSAAPLVQLAHARALREEWVNPWEIQPMYLRAPDAQINWSDASRAPPTTRAGWRGERHLTTARPHRRRGDRDRADAQARPVGDHGDRAGVVPEAVDRRRVRRARSRWSRRGERHYIVARAAIEARRLRRADVRGRRGARHQHRRRARRTAGRASATRLLAELAWEAIRRECLALHARGAGLSNVGAQALYRRFGFAPAGVRQQLLREHRGRDRDVVPRHRRAAVPCNGSPSCARRPRDDRSPDPATVR